MTPMWMRPRGRGQKQMPSGQLNELYTDFSYPPVHDLNRPIMPLIPAEPMNNPQNRPTQPRHTFQQSKSVQPTPPQTIPSQSRPQQSILQQPTPEQHPSQQSAIQEATLQPPTSKESTTIPPTSQPLSQCQPQTYQQHKRIKNLVKNAKPGAIEFFGDIQTLDLKSLGITGPPSTIVIVNNIHEHAVEKDLRVHFRKAGVIKRVDLAVDGGCRFAVVEYTTINEAIDAVAKYRKSKFFGRELEVTMVQANNPVPPASSEAAADKDAWKRCAVCNIDFSDKQSFDTHAESLMHKAKMGEPIAPSQETVKVSTQQYLSKSAINANTLLVQKMLVTDSYAPPPLPDDPPTPATAQTPASVSTYASFKTASTLKSAPTATETTLQTLSGTVTTATKSDPGDTATEAASDDEDHWRRCAVCKVSFAHQQQFMRHLRGMMHMQKVIGAKVQAGEISAIDTPPVTTTKQKQKQGENPTADRVEGTGWTMSSTAAAMIQERQEFQSAGNIYRLTKGEKLQYGTMQAAGSGHGLASLIGPAFRPDALDEAKRKALAVVDAFAEEARDGCGKRDDRLAGRNAFHDRISSVSGANFAERREQGGAGMQEAAWRETGVSEAYGRDESFSRGRYRGMRGRGGGAVWDRGARRTSFRADHDRSRERFDGHRAFDEDRSYGHGMDDGDYEPYGTRNKSGHDVDSYRGQAAEGHYGMEMGTNRGYESFANRERYHDDGDALVNLSDKGNAKSIGSGGPSSESATTGTPQKESGLRTNQPATSEGTLKKLQEEDLGDDNWKKCTLCKVDFSDEQDYLRHTRGMMHMAKIISIKQEEGELPQERNTDTDWRERVEFLDDKRYHTDDIENVQQRALKPSEIGREIKSEFYCELCSVTCTSQLNLMSHMLGSKHLKMLELGERGELEWVKVDEEGPSVELSGRVPYIQVFLEATPEPIVGLEYVVEYWKSDPPTKDVTYVCNLCKAKCDSNTIRPHVIGAKHRSAFLKLHHPDMIHQAKVVADTKSDLTTQLEYYCGEIERSEGRQKMKIVLDKDHCRKNVDAVLVKTKLLMQRKRGSLINEISYSEMVKRRRQEELNTRPLSSPSEHDEEDFRRSRSPVPFNHIPTQRPDYLNPHYPLPRPPDRGRYDPGRGWESDMRAREMRTFRRSVDPGEERSSGYRGNATDMRRDSLIAELDRRDRYLEQLEVDEIMRKREELLKRKEVNQARLVSRDRNPDAPQPTLPRTPIEEIDYGHTSVSDSDRSLKRC